MDFYRKMIIKILEASETGREARVLKILKSGYDLTQKERRELEELIDSIILCLMERFEYERFNF